MADSLPVWPLPPEEPEAARRPTRIQGGRFVAGLAIAIAIATHLPGGGLWLATLYSFTFFATPDFLFPAILLAFVFELASFVACVVPGIWLARRRGLGLGLLVGWAVGIVGVILGTFLIYLLALNADAADAASASELLQTPVA